jgi:hypothetical protein
MSSQASALKMSNLKEKGLKRGPDKTGSSIDPGLPGGAAGAGGPGGAQKMKKMFELILRLR